MRDVTGRVPADLEAASTYLQSPAGTVVSAAVEPHVLFSTDDPLVAERLGSPLLGRHRLTTSAAAAGRFRATLRAVVIGPLTLGCLQLVESTQLAVAGSAARFLVFEPMRGTTAVRSGATSFVATPDRAVVLEPGRATTMDCPAGAAYLIVGIEQEALVAELRRLLGRAPARALSFLPEMDLAGPASCRWNMAVEVLQAELPERSSLLRRGIGQGRLEEFLMSALLFGQPSTSSDLLSGPAAGTEGRTTTAAKQFIEVNLSERLTLPAVAAAAGVSVRTLEAAFRADLRATPTAFIRSRRLDRARADLLDADGSGADRVTDVATRWGISHLGRFAADYRARFGECPSQTLRRPRA